MLSRKVIPYFFIFPAFFIITFIMLYPFTQSIIISLYDLYYLRPGEAKFIGLGNYINLFQDTLFLYSLGITVYIVCLSVILQLVVGLGIALLVSQPIKGTGVMKSLLIIPWALPGVIVGGMWYWIFNPSYGLINGILRYLGIIGGNEIILWLGSPFNAIHSIILVDVWRLAPFVAIVLAAGLATIPKELYEASIIDGASAIKRFFNITLPLLKPFIINVLIIRSIFAFQIFDIIYVLTRGGPGTATYVLMYYIWNKGFNQLYMGLSAAASYILTLFIISSVLFFTIISKKEVRII